ncbi:MAG: hypothetical protein QUS12_13525 [Methanosarcina sp.]|nr:hypothetical protein [Methanosarcina sp.]
MIPSKIPGKRDTLSLPIRKTTGVSEFNPGPTKYKLKEKVSDL